MKYKTVADGYILRFNRGEKLIEQLNQFAKDHALTAAWLNGLGGALSATLGFYDLDKKEYIWQDFTNVMEVTSLQGNISLHNNMPMWHVHGTFSGNDYVTFGGHVKELEVAATCEVRISVFVGETFERSYSNSVGLPLLF